MATDAATAAAVAALVVSIFAMTVAVAQVVQQYLVTGNLIRICDGVVYGKMPGRGRRIWTFTQFRFRVVYSMPQVSLRTSLWIDSLPHSPSFTKGHLPVPDLRHADHGTQGNFRQALSSAPGLQQYSEYSAVPGEACWVSFFRMAQNASGNDLFCDLIDCDADRCPTDLPVAPMQVSMRDMIVVAIMAGMRCTDASFEKKSLAMEGAAGTITTSSHPLLGVITHFAPRNYGRPAGARSRMDDTLGLRVGDGSISPEWMARMWDVVVVAGRQYDLRDRRFYEAYEGDSWITLSNSRALVKASAPKSFRSPSPVLSYRLRSTSPGRSVRLRRDSRVPSRSRSTRDMSSGFDNPASWRLISAAGRPHGRPETDIQYARNDGDWWFASDTARSTSSPESSPPPTSAPTRIPTQKPPAQSPRPSHKPLRSFFRNVLNAVPRKSTKSLPTADLESNDLTNISKESKESPSRPQPTRAPPSDRNRQPPTGSAPLTSQDFAVYPAWVSQRPQLNARKKLDGRALQDYIEEKKKHEDSVLPINGKLLLTWPGEAGDEPETGAEFNEIDGWPQSALHLRQELVSSYVEKWRTVVNKRQVAREERTMQDELEIETHSGSRSSNFGQRNRLRRSSPGTGRSISRERRNPRSHSLNDKSHMRSRGRVAPTNAIEDSHYRSKSSDVTYAPARSGSGHLATDRRVAYGDEPIRRPRHNRPLKSSNDPVHNNEQSPQRGRQQSNAGSESEERQDETSANQQSPARDHQPKRRVRVLLPEHSNAEEAEPLSDTKSSSRESSVERPRPREGSVERFRPRRSSVERLRSRESSVERSRPGADSRTQKEVERPKSGNVADEDVPSADDGQENVNDDLMQPRSDTPKGILKRPRDQFPEEANPVREGVAPLKAIRNEGIPSGARWTKISRQLVNPEALDRNSLRYEERDDHVVVLSVLSREDIMRLAELTKKIREAREIEWRKRVSQGNHGKDSRDAHESESGTEGEGSSADWSNTSLLGSTENSRISESPTSMSEGEDEHAGSTSISGDKSQPMIPVSSDPAQSTTTSINSTITVRDNTRMPSPGRPRRRRASTRSDTSSPKGSESGEDQRTIESQVTNRWSQMGDSLALAIVDDTVSESSADTKEPSGQGVINWFWISQADVLPGYFATPWHNHFSESTCCGAIMTMLVALEYLTEDSTLRYVERQTHCEEWVYQGKSTHPSYAINAMGGVIVSGVYNRVQFDCFETKIPPIELLRSYEYQLNRSVIGRGSSSVVELLGELMGLDSWLSFCGRLPEIYDGRNNLHRSMPALVQKIMVDFEYEFSNLERTPTEGGLQIIKEMAELILHTLEKEMLSEAEQLFAIVAMVRAAKMALCVVHGPSTAKLRDILVNDVQVYLV
ncbi:hypothetical protein H2200_009883 [Cladophialophora chaetospira]|uniref:DUF8035 domain-containing protein n=1 Tax=Cladophialophora chaetospira TaxID=386627 RepID=A0AA39CF97_9EURO|nr:hypothetical protein H2200_009883 [Cladophialophora chaetospira]